MTETIVPYCDLHNRDKVRSKYPDKKTGEIGYYCPDCYREWKDKQQPQKTDGNAILLDEFNRRFDGLAEWCAKTNIKLNEILKKLEE